MSIVIPYVLAAKAACDVRRRLTRHWLFFFKVRLAEENWTRACSVKEAQAQIQVKCKLPMPGEQKWKILIMLVWHTKENEGLTCWLKCGRKKEITASPWSRLGLWLQLVYSISFTIIHSLLPPFSSLVAVRSFAVFHWQLFTRFFPVVAVGRLRPLLSLL